MEPLLQTLSALERAFETEELVDCRRELRNLQALLDNDFSFARKSALRDWTESLLVALLIALFLRTFVLEAFKIPSGSMIPTLLVGDHIFVNKFIYGIRLPIINKRIVEWGQPKRGEVIVFVYPHDPSKDYIKRVVGLPGDRIRVSGEDVFVNGEKVELGKEALYTYNDEVSGDKRDCVLRPAKLGEAEFDLIYNPRRNHQGGEYIVEEGHLFVMGDNRDNSADSRVWGQVPLDNVKGRAIVVWWSSSSLDGIRFSRMGHLIE